VTRSPTSPDAKSWRLLTWPNRISLLRLLLIAPFVVLLLNQREFDWARLAALGIFIVMGISDFLDGMLARRLDCHSRLGAILDPLADKLMITCSVVLLSQYLPDAPQARLPAWLVVAVVGKDLWVVIGFVVINLVTDRFRSQPNWAGKVCTFGQVVLVSLTLLAPELNRLHAGLGERIVVSGSAVVAGLCILAGIGYTRAGLRFLVTEEKPLDHPRGSGEAGTMASEDGS